MTEREYSKACGCLAGQTGSMKAAPGGSREN